MSKTLFISDLHLSQARPDLCRAFSFYCQHHASQAESLYILGDLSDAWLGDDDDGETAILIKQTLSQLVASGTKVYVMAGNRDFLMGHDFAQACGLTLLSDPYPLELYGQQVLLMHGDSLCTDDKEYMAFRAQIQNPAGKAMLLEKSLEERRQIAAQLRAQSKSANASKAEDIMDVNQQAVLATFAQHNIDLLIHGHTHRPAVHQLPINRLPVDTEHDTNPSNTAKQRFVLGDWENDDSSTSNNAIKAWEVIAQASGFELRSLILPT